MGVRSADRARRRRDRTARRALSLRVIFAAFLIATAGPTLMHTPLWKPDPRDTRLPSPGIDRPLLPPMKSSGTRFRRSASNR